MRPKPRTLHASAASHYQNAPGQPRPLGDPLSSTLSLRTESYTLSPNPEPYTLASQAQKYRKFRVRTYSTLTMIGGFVLIIYLGHVPLMLLIFTIQVGRASGFMG